MMEICNINDIKKISYDTAITVGMFDGVHVGHRHMVRHLAARAVERGLKPVVVTFRNHPRSVLKAGEGVSLLTTFEERMELLESNGVEKVVTMDFDSETARLSACEFASQVLVEKLNMKLLLLGYDNKFGSRANDDFGMLPALGATTGFEIIHDEPVLVDGVDVSSTKIRKALADGNIEKANRMLGIPYRLCGEVVHGRHVGTALGFPTANVDVAGAGKVLPAEGVYALRALVGGDSFAAVGNLGGQPTFGQETPTLEVNLVGFDGDLYGRVLAVDFLSRLRDIRRFGSCDELVAQIGRDKEECLEKFKVYR